jgi:hypothetical protein
MDDNQASWLSQGVRFDGNIGQMFESKIPLDNLPKSVLVRVK